ENLSACDIPYRGPELAELGEEVGKCLAHARGLAEPHAGNAQAQHAEAHGDAVIVVGLDLRPDQRAGLYGERIATLGDPRAALGQLAAQRLDPLAFLYPEAPEIGEARGRWREGRQHDRGHDAVREVGPAGVGRTPRLLDDKLKKLLVGLQAALG